jgi:hypothetical protein
MNELIWRPKNHNYEKNEQSRKEDKPLLVKLETIEEETNEDQEPIIILKAQKKELKEIIDPNTFYDNNGIFRMSSSKREEVNLKMHDRELISQCSQNPYLVQNNYIEDLNMQQNFLMPKNSNFKDKKD